MWLSRAFVIEEGFPIDELREIAADMAEAAADCGRRPRHRRHEGGRQGCRRRPVHHDCGRRRDSNRTDSSGPEHVRPGDVVLLSGNMADHGMAVMLARGDLMLDADIRSDTAPLGRARSTSLLDAAPSTRWMRDPTRGGVATVCNELARDTNLAVVLDEALLPIAPAVRRRLRPARHRSAVRRQRGQGRRGGRARRGRRRARRPCAPIRSGQRHDASARSSPSRRRSSCCSPASAARRIVDMLVGDPLPRIC